MNPAEIPRQMPSVLQITSLLIANVAIALTLDTSAGEPSLELVYDTPAADWMTEALPIGNGYMGAMFFGGTTEEHIQFSEGSLWAGGPGASPEYNFGNRPGAAAHLEEVRRLIHEGKRGEAHALANAQLTGVIHKPEGTHLDFGDYGANQTMGDLYVEVGDKSPTTGYRRTLDLRRGLGTVTYRAGGTQHSRTFLGSYPHRAMAYHFTNDNAAGCNYIIRIDTPHPVDRLEVAAAGITLQGHLQDNGLEFETRVAVKTDGEARAEGNTLRITGAHFVTLYHAASTAYQNHYPDYRGNYFQAQNEEALRMLAGLPFETIQATHTTDYQRLFNRVSLYLGPPSTKSTESTMSIASTESTPTTDARLRAYRDGTPDPALEALLFHYARYLMISASRPRTLPMHLQGKWNNSTNPPWAADYHTDINEQMLYWPAEVTNLPECHVPLLEYIGSLVEPGRVSARDHFGTRGWVVNTMNNAYGFTAPGWDFPWGLYPAGAGWLCQHLWEHYLFTGDLDYLRDQAYPIMKEAALFWIDYLQDDGVGHLVSIPSYSPEHGGISGGASMDHQIAWDLLNNCVEAAEALGIADTFTTQARATRDRILPPTVGRWGQLQEWIEDVDDPKDTHRHVSHLFALYPGSQITPSRTPEWANAAQTSLEARGDAGTGWSLAWKVCFWARLQEGDHAYRLLRNVLQLTGEKKVVMEQAGGVYANLFCAHPPFQLDGNMGAAAGIAEMLIQSHAGELHFLPALPGAWPEGHVTGLAARGGYTVDIAWSEGKLTRATLHAKQAGSVKIRYGNSTRTLTVTEGPNTLEPDSFLPTADAKQIP